MIWIFLFSFSARGELLETYLRKLQSAQNHQQVDKIQKEFKKITEDHRVCSIQIKQVSLPVACYRVLNAENEWKTITRENWRLRLSHLDEHCRRVAQNANKGSSSPELTLAQELSPRCKSLVLKAARIRKYRSQEIFSNEFGAELEVSPLQ